MLRSLVDFLLGRKGEKPAQPEAPYKVEAPVAAEPAPAKCGCGRSQSGLCVGLHKLTAEEWAAHEANPNAVKAVETKKKRTFKKREPGETKATVAKIKAPAKPKAVPRPRTPK